MSIHFQDETVTLHHGHALTIAKTLPSESVASIVTSPPYWGLRDYESEGQIGQEETPEEYVQALAAVFAELHRVLAKDGTLWINLGDTYSSQPGWGRGGSSQLQGRKHAPAQDTVRHRRKMAPKNLMGMPWRVAFALQDAGWLLRSEVIWHKKNCMPESVKDRFATTHERLFLFTKSSRYYFNLDGLRVPHAAASLQRAAPHRAAPGKAAREGAPYDGTAAPAHTLSLEQIAHPLGKNPGTVWEISTQPFTGPHYAVMPEELARRCLVAGTRPGGIVLDPFSGTGTVGLVAQKHGHPYIGIDTNADYLDLSLTTRLQTGILIPHTASA